MSLLEDMERYVQLRSEREAKEPIRRTSSVYSTGRYHLVYSDKPYLTLVIDRFLA